MADEQEGIQVLNLAGADMTAGDFEPIPSGTYPAYIKKIETKFTKGGEDAKLPAGTPMLNVHFVLTEESEFPGRYVFRQLIIPPAKVNGKPYEHHKSMMGQLARFLVCAGFEESVVTSGEFDLAGSDIIGRTIGVKVKKYYNKYKEEEDNKVDGFKPIGDLVGAGAAAGGIT